MSKTKPVVGAPPPPTEEERQLVAPPEKPIMVTPGTFAGLTPQTPAGQWPTSLDLTRPDHRALVFASQNPADYTVPTGGSIEFTATHWLVYAEEFENQETGEIETSGVLVLFNREGKTLKSTSRYAVRRLKLALELYTRSEWESGITFMIADRPSKFPGRHYHDVRIKD